MKILVTGGAGFIGSHLCEALIGMGDTVICLDNFITGSRKNIAHLFESGKFELAHRDVRQPFTFQVDQIYHLACPASPIHYQRNHVHTFDTAVLGTRNALALARDLKARVLVASTSEAYGDPTEHPQREAYWGNVNPCGPRSCYDEGKRAGEALCYAWHKEYGVDVRIARIFNTFGKRMAVDDGRVVSNLVVQALRKESMTVYGDGSQTRSFMYVSDLVRGLLLLMKDGPTCDPVNLGNPVEFTVSELADLIGDMTGFSLRRELPLPQDDPARRKPDIEKAKRLLGWEPKVPLAEGLRKTIDYFKKVV